MYKTRGWNGICIKAVAIGFVALIGVLIWIIFYLNGDKAAEFQKRSHIRLPASSVILSVSIERWSFDPISVWRISDPNGDIVKDIGSYGFRVTSDYDEDLLPGEIVQAVKGTDRNIREYLVYKRHINAVIQYCLQPLSGNEVLIINCPL